MTEAAQCPGTAVHDSPMVWMRLLLCVTVGVAGGCAGSYDVGVLNMTDREMDGVTTRIGGETATHGYVGPNMLSVWGALPHPVPESATVTWDDRGTKHERTISIPRSLKHFRGYLYLRFMPDGRVDVVPIPRAGARADQDPRSAPTAQEGSGAPSETRADHASAARARAAAPVDSRQRAGVDREPEDIVLAYLAELSRANAERMRLALWMPPNDPAGEAAAAKFTRFLADVRRFARAMERRFGRGGNEGWDHERPTPPRVPGGCGAWVARGLPQTTRMRTSPSWAPSTSAASPRAVPAGQDRVGVEDRGTDSSSATAATSDPNFVEFMRDADAMAAVADARGVYSSTDAAGKRLGEAGSSGEGEGPIAGADRSPRH